MPELSGAVQDRPQSSLVTRLKITGTLAAIGGVCGAVAGGALTYLGHVVTGYPGPVELGIYLGNAGIMAVIGGTVAPFLAWSVLRTVPLWRAIAEPSAAALGVGMLTMSFAPSLFGVVEPIAILGAILRLRREFRESARPELPPDQARARSFRLHRSGTCKRR
jgi:hypothetical protein